eukprot:1236715-Prymnesium_polylepis.1
MNGNSLSGPPNATGPTSPSDPAPAQLPTPSGTNTAQSPACVRLWSPDISTCVMLLWMRLTLKPTNGSTMRITCGGGEGGGKGGGGDGDGGGGEGEGGGGAGGDEGEGGGGEGGA